MPDISDMISDFIKDIDKSFWNGDARLKVLLEDFVRKLTGNPDMTLAQARETWGDKGLVATGIRFQVDPADVLMLGERRGTDTGFSVSVQVDSEVGAWLHLIFSKEGIDNVKDEGPPALQEILTRYTTPGDGTLVVLSFHGNVGAGLAASHSFAGGIHVGLDFGAGGGYQWFHCRPAADDTKVLDAIGQSLAEARLPQTDLRRVLQAGKPITPVPNEVIASQYLGFVNVGVGASWGFDFGGTKRYAVGALELATRLEIQSAARLNLGYQLAGAFRLLALPAREEGWVRVVLDKDRSSQFDFGFGVEVDVRLETEGLPQKDETGLALIESILGTTAPQILREAMEIALMEPEELRAKASGFLKSIIGKWVGKAFDEIGDELETVLAEIRKLEKLVDQIDDRLISLYERLLPLDLDPDSGFSFEEAVRRVESVLEAAKALRAQKLLENLAGPRYKRFVELLTQAAFSDLFLGFERDRDEIVERLRKSLDDFKKLVTGDARDAIRRLLQAKLEALHIPTLMDNLARFDTVEELEAQADEAVLELVERLIDRAFDKLDEVFDEIRALARNFSNILNAIHDAVEKALKAQGRLDVSWAYQKVRKDEHLVDLEIRVGTTANPVERGMELYNRAMRGDWQEVLGDENLEWVRIREAAFSSVLNKTKTLSVHLFGWNYTSVSSILATIDTSIQVGPGGLMTVYTLSVEGRRRTASERRGAEMQYLLQVAGRVKGVFGGRSLSKAEVDAVENLGNLQNVVRYDIRDELTSLEELGLYFDVGLNLGIIDPTQRDHLIHSVGRLRQAAGLSSEDYGKVGLTYTVSFGARALGDALVHDFSSDFVPLWEGGFRSVKRPKDNREALERLYVDRLIYSYFIHGTRDAESNAVPALYEHGIYDAFVKAPNPILESWAHRYIVSRGKESVAVDVPVARVHWAQKHYFVNVRVSRFLDRFRNDVAAGKAVALVDLHAFMLKLVDRLEEIGEGEGPSQQVLPVLLLDEMVRRSEWSKSHAAAGPNGGGGAALVGGSPARQALLEVTLYDRDGKTERHHIPISG